MQTDIPFDIDSGIRRALAEILSQNNLPLGPNRFTSTRLTDASPRHVAYLAGPYSPTTSNPAADEFRIFFQLTAWADGHCYIQFILQDCEGDFINRTEDATETMNLFPIHYTR